MENYFYLFGFIYILLLARKIYRYTVPVKEEDVLKIDENTTVADLIDAKEKIDSSPKKSPIWIILDILCFFWLVIGYMNNQSDKTLFLFLSVLVVSYLVFSISLVVYAGMMVVFGNKPNVDVSTSNNPRKSIQLSRTIVVTEVVVVSLILVKHYFLI